MKEHVYHCVARRQEAHSLPAVGLMYWEGFRTKKYSHAVKRLTWGYAVYSIRLTQEEMERYGLIESGRD